jgi:hypothetical protein
MMDAGTSCKILKKKERKRKINQWNNVFLPQTSKKSNLGGQAQLHPSIHIINDH